MSTLERTFTLSLSALLATLVICQATSISSRDLIETNFAHIGLASAPPSQSISVDMSYNERNENNNGNNEVMTNYTTETRIHETISNEDLIGKTTPEIIELHGYPVEIHHLRTDDGYVLELHRIPWGKNDSQRENFTKPIVFLQHCLLCSSSDWVINTPDKALGFLLADQGFDVWMGNARGNTYSRKHDLYSITDKKFWDFSWDQIAYYDIPASIDYVLTTTNSTKLNYIGFSMGTLAFFAMMSEKPQYNNKVNFMVALGPVAFLEHLSGPLAYVARYARYIEFFTDFFGIYEVLPGGKFLDLMTSIFCDPFVTNFAPICDDILLRLIGMDTNYTNKELLPLILSHTPAGTSVKNMIHFMQAATSGKFQKFDYGSVGNIRSYKSQLPPSYRLNKTTVPVALYWAENDWFANPKDVENLATLLPNVILNRKVPDKIFSHVDFLWSASSVELIYKEVITLIKQYN